MWLEIMNKVKIKQFHILCCTFDASNIRHKNFHPSILYDAPVLYPLDSEISLTSKTKIMVILSKKNNQEETKIRKRIFFVLDLQQSMSKIIQFQFDDFYNFDVVSSSVEKLP